MPPLEGLNLLESFHNTILPFDERSFTLRRVIHSFQPSIHSSKKGVSNLSKMNRSTSFIISGIPARTTNKLNKLEAALYTSYVHVSWQKWRWWLVNEVAIIFLANRGIWLRYVVFISGRFVIDSSITKFDSSFIGPFIHP